MMTDNYLKLAKANLERLYGNLPDGSGGEATRLEKRIKPIRLPRSANRASLRRMASPWMVRNHPA